MKKLIVASIPLALIALGLAVHKAKIFANRITFIETANLATHPAAHKGDLLVFQAPSVTNNKNIGFSVYFDEKIHPCAETTIPLQSGETAQCEVIVEPPAAARYFFSIEQRTEGKPSVGKCPPQVCSGVVIVGTKPGPAPLVPLPQQSTSYPAVETLIYNNNDGRPVSDAASAYQGQPVTWFKNGIDTIGWTMQFKDEICAEGTKIVSVHGEVAYCTLTKDAPAGNHSYTITVGVTSGPDSQIYVK